MDLIWHYTTGQHLTPILGSGELRVSEWEKKNGVKPAALWLSTNPIWEHTATKLVKQHGQIIEITKEEQHVNFGLIRFAIEFKKDQLCTWARYKHKSNTPSEVYKNMERQGIKQGANPLEWFASFKNIPLTECIIIEKWNGTTWGQLPG